jgi:anti-anti-sigma factor
MERDTDLKWQSSRRAGGVSVRFSGALTHLTVNEMDAGLESLAREGVSRVVLDLTGVWFFDSTALGHLRGKIQELRSADCDVAIVRPAPAFEHTMHQLSLDLGIQFVETAEEFLRENEPPRPDLDGRPGRVEST